MKIKILLIFILTYQIVISQKITGTVSNKNDIPVENANVSIWNSNNKEILFGYVYTNEKGFFSIDIKPEIKNVYLTVSCIDFASIAQTISITEQIQKVDFVLENKEIELEEVIVKEDKAIRIKNDTTFYDPKKFLNGSENKVEDLIKKLPGMTVNSKTGEIKFKGKAIETVKLENDDLFGGNYSIGTKNISVEMVEQVQAIENYSDNPLLKGIENSDNVAINLKLKKQKTDYSGTSSISNGASDKILFNDEVNLLGISKTIKSFGITSYNNFGGGTMDINSFSQGFNSSDAPEAEFYATKLISEPTASSSLPLNRTTFNDTFLANYNLIYKLTPKISIKNNLVYFYDQTKAFENFSNQFFLNNSNFKTIQDNLFNKKTNGFKADLKLSYNVNKSSLLVTSASFSNQLLNSNLSSIQNNSNMYLNNLRNDNLFYKLKTNYTWRINDKNAAQFYSEYSKNNIPQFLTISPNNNFISGNFFQDSEQNSKFSRQIFSNSFTYLLNKNNLKQSFVLGFFNETSLLNSKLTENSTTVNGFENNLNYKKANLFLEYFTSFDLFKIKIQPYLSSNWVNQKLKNYLVNDLNKTELVNNFSIQFNFKYNKNGNVLLALSSISKTPEEEFLFLNNVLENNNSYKNNIPSLDIVKNQNITLGYKYYNLIKQIGFDFNLKYQNKQNTFLSNFTINPNFVTTTYFQSPTNIESKTVGLAFEKQINFLSLYFKQTSNYLINNYKNAIDNFEVRNNVSKSLNVSTLIFSTFDFLINFDNKFSYNLSDFTSNNQFVNQRVSLNNTFKILIKPIGNFTYSITQDYFVTNTKTKTNFNFIDFDIKYKSQKTKWLSINFTAKNLLNIKTFTETNNNDFSTTFYSTNLLPRYFLFTTSLNF